MPRSPSLDDLLMAAEWLDAHEPPEPRLTRVAAWLRREAARKERAQLRRQIRTQLEETQPGYTKTREGEGVLERLVEKFAE